MPPTFEYDFANHDGVFKGKSNFSLGLFINNEFVDAKDGQTVDIVNPTTGKTLTAVSCAGVADIDLAVEAAQKAFDNSWGLKVPGLERGKLLVKLADLMERDADELAALESLNNGKAATIARVVDVGKSIEAFRYYAGWADKNHGKTIEVNDSKFAYTRIEPIGVVGQIVPWNFPLWMLSWKLGPALATGNTIVFKPSEWTPLTAIKMCNLIKEAGFPPGVVNVVTGLGKDAGSAISSHMGIGKVAFTGSTLVGRMVMKAAADSNLKKVSLELGGKSPALVLDDTNLEDAIKWCAFGILFNHGQTCCAGSRVFVHESVYDKFMGKFTEVMKNTKVGDPFHAETFQGPQVTQTHFDRIMNHIDIGKQEGATLHLGGERHGDEGFFIQPTIFTDVKPDMRIVKEEIFGPVVVVAKFHDTDDLMRLANDSMYGLAAAIFTKDIQKAINTANALHAGTVWINCFNQIDTQVPFGGFKHSGIGRELGEYALDMYTEVKAVHVNLSQPAPF